MNILLIICFMSSALFGMEPESESLVLNADKRDFVAIDIEASSFKESFKDAVNKEDTPYVQECLEQISKKFILNTQLDPLAAGYLQKYFSLRSHIQQKFSDEYLIGIEESKQPAMIKSLMKLTKMRLQKATTDTLDVYNREQFKNKCRDKVLVGLVISGACLFISGVTTFGIMMATNLI